MPRNLEIKVSVPRHAGILRLLRSLGAEDKGILRQKDVYYRAGGNGLLKLRVAGNRAELIHYNRAEAAKKRWSDYSVLPLAPSAEKYFSGIFPVEAVVKKRRRLFLFDNTRIHLDIVEGLGTFLELETLVLAGAADANKRFTFVLEYLGLAAYPELRLSYRDLMLAKGNP